MRVYFFTSSCNKSRIRFKYVTIRISKPIRIQKPSAIITTVKYSILPLNIPVYTVLSRKSRNKKTFYFNQKTFSLHPGHLKLFSCLFIHTTFFLSAIFSPQNGQTYPLKASLFISSKANFNLSSDILLKSFGIFIYTLTK